MLVLDESVRDFRRRSPIGFAIERLFAALQFVSLATWLWGTRTYSASLQNRREYEAWRSRRVDWLVLAWAVLLVVSLSWVWSPKPDVPVWAATLGVLRVVDIVQANINAHVFDGMRSGRSNDVSAVARSTLLTVWNYLELIGWFAIFYMYLGGLSWTLTSHRAFEALYFSAITQVTIGFGDLHPDEFHARELAMTQGLLGTLFLAFAIGRFASALQPISGPTDDNDTKRRAKSEYSPIMDPDWARFEYFKLGISYYISGRFAYYAHAVPVAGNLLHHAIEMFLKGCLVRSGVTEKERLDLGHNLVDIWRKFRTHAPDPELDAFNDAVTALNAFEELRYPENAARAIAKSGKKGGVTIAVGPGPHEPAARADGKEVALYSADTEKIDGLVISLFKAGSCNPLAFLPLGQIGKDYLALHNSHATSWGLPSAKEPAGI